MKRMGHPNSPTISHRRIGFHYAEPLIALVFLGYSRIVIHLPR